MIPLSRLPQGLVSLVLWSETAQGLGYVWLWGLLLLSGVSGARHWWNSPFFLKDVLAKCWKSHSLSLEMFYSVGGKGSFLERAGSWSLTLLFLELVSNSWWVLADGRYCIAISTWGDVMATGFGKSLGSIPMSMQAALLKYSLWIFLHMYRIAWLSYPGHWIPREASLDTWM